MDISDFIKQKKNIMFLESNARPPTRLKSRASNALGVRLNISGYACSRFCADMRHHASLRPTLQVVRCISACIYAAIKSPISELSSLRSA